MTGPILYHVVSPVHLRNAAIIQRGLPAARLVALVEERAVGILPEDVAASPVDVVDLRRRPWAEAWDPTPAAVVFSSLQPRPPVLRLLAEAARRHVPAVALEESNQLALNGGRVNNYLLPVDAVGAASAYESEALQSQGVPADGVRVTGWPFLPDACPADLARERARGWGLDPDRPVVALALTRLNDAGETAPVRARLLETAWQALPSGHQLAIKSHPIEPTAAVEAFARVHAPGARVVPSQAAIQELLAVSSAVLSRGASQVCLEALLLGVPPLVIDVGRRTPFHEDAPRAVARGEGELRDLLARLDELRTDGLAYANFRQRHAPFDPAQARANACRLVDEAARGRLARDGSRLRLPLHLAFAGLHAEAGEALRQSAPGPRLERTRRIVSGQATVEDAEALLSHEGNPADRAAIQSLLAAQVRRSGRAPTRPEIQAMADWPPSTNAPWYMAAAERWGLCLLLAEDPGAYEGFLRRLDVLAEDVPEYGALRSDLRRARRRRMGPLAFQAARLGRRAGRLARRLLARA